MSHTVYAGSVMAMAAAPAFAVLARSYARVKRHWGADASLGLAGSVAAGVVGAAAASLADASGADASAPTGAMAGLAVVVASLLQAGSLLAAATVAMQLTGRVEQSAEPLQPLALWAAATQAAGWAVGWAVYQGSVGPLSEAMAGHFVASHVAQAAASGAVLVAATAAAVGARVGGAQRWRGFGMMVAALASWEAVGALAATGATVWVAAAWGALALSVVVAAAAVVGSVKPRVWSDPVV
ncbi:hypothetical protein FNF27_01610 [Cafeteria roenbergensis]|uniref:Uncharacterized protein n=1 Tax=Cafeteria roenbergensis TaxID=33653 RepID=A0A5A8EHW1_CAFRO|nr:hypothetical protein FNF27_01610 [Cafeteria roenbergensis]